ncbi:GNAT family N-acetyltransferase [Paenibacillus tarimensis]|uniref:GNAT family N-acetyltransferase n=1 Tax=Paenibacillus tarimensis TaxID=416012 RepID=UPI001F2DED81|nr:GNAT family protein [Paenibacillus tarimensis]MCF2946420.1 GNAT family N-acetyltransferase [Paenibacillus tarimensis]
MPHLVGTRIILREYQWEDLPHIREWVNDYEITNNLHDVFLFPNTVYETESFLKKMIEGTSESKGFVIADKAALSYIGQIDLHHIDYRNRNAVLGIVIGKKDYWGMGYGQEAITLLEHFVFNTLNLNRLELDVYEYNERAYNSYLKCGFKEEGRMRQKLFRDGRYWDVIKMSILKKEYEELFCK